MKQLELANRLREGLAKHASEVEASAAAKHFDVSVISENLVLGLLKALLDLKNLRNLNAAEKANFAGLDLIDDIARVGVQVTATPTLEKIKETIATCKRHGIDSRIDRLIMGSTPIPRTLPSKLIMSREECHGTTKKVQCGVQA